MCHQIIKREKSFRCLRRPVLVEKLPEIVIPCGYKNVYCSCAYLSMDAESKPCYHWNSWKWVRKCFSYPQNNWGFFLTAFSVFRWFLFLCCEVGEWQKKFCACNGLVKLPIFQGKKKKRKREKLQESASGRPWPTLTYHSPQEYFRNQGLRYLIFTCFSLTLASDRCFKILHFECKLVKMHTIHVSFPLHLSVQQSSLHQHLWLNLRIATITVLLYLCFSPESMLYHP